MCLEAKKQYFNEKIAGVEENSKELFKLANKLLQKQGDTSLPTHSCEKQLANEIGHYFKEKIEKIRINFPQPIVTEVPQIIPNVTPFREFSPIGIEVLSKMILSGNSKSC